MAAGSPVHGRFALTGSDAIGVLTELLDAWQRAFNAHQVTEIVSLFRHDALFQGISPHLRAGPEEISEYYGSVVGGTTATAEVLCAAQLGRAIVGGFADVAFTAPTGEVHPARLSIVAKREEHTWLIQQYHAASRR